MSEKTPSFSGQEYPDTGVDIHSFGGVRSEGGTCVHNKRNKISIPSLRLKEPTGSSSSTSTLSVSRQTVIEGEI